MTATAPREERPQRQRSERRAISLFQPDIADVIERNFVQR